MLSESVLYAKENKKISFISNNITRLKNRFKITGMLTIRGISKKIELEAKLNIMNENNFENTSFLNFHILANIFRSDYGASGYSGLVGDKIVLNSNITLRPDHRELK
jgi:polyisoprenoid-binding protein YceI